MPSVKIKNGKPKPATQRVSETDSGDRRQKLFDDEDDNEDANYDFSAPKFDGAMGSKVSRRRVVHSVF